MSRGKSLLGDTVVLAFGTLGGRALGVLLLPIYTSALTRAELGTVDLVTTSIDLVLPLIFGYISQAVLRFAMVRSEKPDDILRTALTFVGGASALVVVVAGVVTLWWPEPYPLIVAAIMIGQSLTLALGAWAQAVGRVRAYAASGLVQAAVVGAANVVFLLGMGLGVTGFLVSLVLGSVAAASVLVVRLPILTAVRFGHFDRALLRRMLAFSAPLIPNTVLWWLTNISGRYFLAFTHGVEQVGIFGVATRICTVITMGTTVIAQAWQLSSNRAADDADKARFYSDVFRYYAAALLLAVASLLIVLKPLLHLLVTPAFFEAWKPVPLLLAGAVFAAFATFYEAIYTAAHRTTGVFRTSFVAGVLSLLLNGLLVPALGVMGAALSIALCFLVLWIIRVVDSQSITPTTVSPRVVVPALALVTVQAGVLYLPVGGIVAYPLMIAAWLGLLVLLRREVQEVVGWLVRTASSARIRARRPRS